MPAELNKAGPSSIQMRTLEITRDITIASPVEIAFQSVLAELGPEGEMPDGKPFPMLLEPWPGGRWYRDLSATVGKGAGHLWGHVQVIKPPTLLEICGPIFMSYPAVSHVQYRLTPQDGKTRLQLTHRAFGLIPDDHMEGVDQGWDYNLKRIGEIAAALIAKGENR